MIPKNIKKKHIIKAIEEVKRVGVPKGRGSKKFHLEFNGGYYPPKYVVSLANKYANGKDLDSSEFSGGGETNSFLRDLGFNVMEVSSKKTVLKSLTGHLQLSSSRVHRDERCPKCKETVRKLLERIYRKVEQNYKFKVGTRSECFIKTPHYSKLKKIYECLQNHRGFRELTKSKTLPNCDFFIPKPGFIVEFDESQHFTLSRKISLQNYPQNLRLGFPLRKWFTLCEKINAKDNDPPFRDEQRAWYDTLRDFLPELEGLEPTVRLYSKGMKWCSLSPEKPEDVTKFRELIENRRKRSRSWMATVILESNEEDYNYKDERLKALSQIVDWVANEMGGDGVILFPGGWFDANKQKARSLYEWVEKKVRGLLGKNEKNIVVCMGIDGRVTKDNAKDQIGMAISKRGIEAIGRKFCTAPGEEGNVELAKDHLSKEEDKFRVFELNGRKYFLCVCYDCFGIKKRGISNLGIDVILDLVHGFDDLGKDGYGKGHPYFAKHGFAGTSKLCKRVVFGAAVFFDPVKPKNWPSGVFWNQGRKSTRKWRYEDNPMKPIKTKELNINEGVALVSIYNIEEI